VSDSLFAGGGEAGALMRSIDWCANPLGPVESWSPALSSTVALLLHNQSSMLLWWGPRYVQIYNDAYRPVLGDKHPRAMGQPTNECWSEIWNIIGPMIDQPYHGGPASTSDDLQLLINRKGFAEETHFRLAYSPVPDPSVERTGIGGVLATVTETTEQVYGERQLRMLRELGTHAVTANTAELACAAAAATLNLDPWDVPFALFYLLDRDGEHARLAASAGFDGDVANQDADLWARAWPLCEAAQERHVSVVHLGPLEAALPRSPSGERSRSAIVLPLASPDHPHAYGVLVCGVSPHRTLDDGYQTFFELVALQVVTTIRNARAFEAQRRRAEELEALDRAKTAFFSNVSHEFRTPLTLMLGPLEEALASMPEGDTRKAPIQTAHRNGLRLLRLVNSLLDFSRIEAGRMKASFHPTDLAALTGELASVFRAAVERAGLRLIVECPALPTPVLVDRDMWETIVLNLVSNAFKFTFAGAIEISLRADGASAQLTVRDTGIGITADALPRVFERFHRIEGARARTHEGSGIGLALVQELVRMHGGTIAVASQPGIGTAFTVSLPFGAIHLPADQIGAQRATSPSGTQSALFAQEAERWLTGEDAHTSASGPAAAHTEDDLSAARILIADDNSDMREYLTRLLAQRWAVHAVPDGESALAALRKDRFDLLLSDVMMPNLGGFELVQAVRSQPALSHLPVIMLSARAGDEARVEGLEIGADDYLIKPFSAREVIARVETHLRLARRRQEIEGNRAKDEFLAMLGHELRNPLTPILATLRLMRMDGGKKFAKERDMIERQALHLARLVDDLLDVSRITRGKLELQRSQIELGAIVTRAIEVATPLLEERGHFLRIDVEPRALVHADENRLVQVVSNLLINSAKYTPPGGRIEISVRSEAEAVALRVRDDGMGIPSALLPHVFDLFRQGRQSSERPLGGLGLGLAVVRSIVELHGGEVSAASEGPGKGSELTVRLPRVPEKRTAKKRALRASTSPASDSPLRILVVDDNRDIVEVLVNLLRRRGHDVAVAYDGTSALAAVKAYRPHVALLDIGLPEIDGYELARRIRAQKETRDVELIAMTGYGQPGDRVRATEAGFADHVTKPFDFEELMKIVERRTGGVPTGAARRSPGRRPRRAPSVATSNRGA
jgi:signal transduction histidine kinase